MKDWKKCTAFLLALVICLGLAACGVGSSEGEREDYYTPGVIEDTDYDFTDDNPAEHWVMTLLRICAHRNMKSSLPMITTIQSPRDIGILTGIGAAPSILWSREIPFTGMNLTQGRGMFKWENRMALYSS